MAANYRVGPSDVFLPSDLAADADTLNSQITAVDSGIDGNEAIPQDLWDGWTAFHGKWLAFYSSSFGSFFSNLETAVNDGNRDQMIQYENQLATFVGQFAAIPGAAVTIPGGLIAPSTGSGDSIGKQAAAVAADLGLSKTTIVLVIVLLVVAVVAFKVVK